MNTIDWLKSKAPNNSQDYFHEIYPPERVVHKEPNSFESPLWHNEINYDAAFVSIIPNGKLWGRYAVITPDNKLLWDCSWSLDGDPKKHEIFQQTSLSPIKYLNETIATLAWVGEGNYFHWFHDILPRIHLLNKSGIKIDKYVVNAYPHHPHTLELLGIPKEKQIPISDVNNFHIQAKRLVVPYPKSLYPKWSSNFINEAITSKIKPSDLSEYKRIYISREDAGYRKVINEKEVFGVLEKKGFKKVLLSKLSLDEQISIFYSAEVIVSPISAALTNITFSKPGTKVIELTYSSGHIFNGFWKICNHLNMNYYYIRCDSVPPFKQADNHNDIIVDLEKLKRILMLAGL